MVRRRGRVRDWVEGKRVQSPRVGLGWGGGVCDWVWARRRRDSDGVVMVMVLVMGEAGCGGPSACAIRMLLRVNIFAVGIAAIERGCVSVNWATKLLCQV